MEPSTHPRRPLVFGPGAALVLMVFAWLLFIGLMLLLRCAIAHASPDVLRAKITTYCPYCSGTTCADSSHVRPGVCAASRNIPMHSQVWLEGHGTLLVTDRGGKVRVGPYTRKGESAVLDRWVPRCLGPYLDHHPRNARERRLQRRNCWNGSGTQRRVPYRIIKAGPAKAGPSKRR